MISARADPTEPDATPIEIVNAVAIARLSPFAESDTLEAPLTLPDTDALTPPPIFACNTPTESPTTPPDPTSETALASLSPVALIEIAPEDVNEPDTMASTSAAAPTSASEPVAAPPNAAPNATANTSLSALFRPVALMVNEVELITVPATVVVTAPPT